MSSGKVKVRWVAWVRLDWITWQAACFFDSESELSALDACHVWLATKPNDIAEAYRTNPDAEVVLLPGGEFPYIKPK